VLNVSAAMEMTSHYESMAIARQLGLDKPSAYEGLGFGRPFSMYAH
jgi:hypothetical protein